MSNSADPLRIKKELRWRTDLLSSSLPFEFRIAKLLVDNGFSIGPEFAYSKNVDGRTVDCSVDVIASKLLWSDDRRIDLQLLIECKYRRPGKVLFFVPDPELDRSYEYDAVEICRLIDEFSTIRLDPNAMWNLTNDLRHCYKGTEIDPRPDGGRTVSDDELVHGLAQLQFALPPLLKQRISLFSLYHRYRMKAPAICIIPILLTTAPIYVANEATSDQDILDAKAISDFAVREKWVVIRRAIGTSVATHVGETFSNGGPSVAESFPLIDALRSQPHNQQPASDLWRALVSTELSIMNRLLSSYICCSADAFPELLQLIEKAAMDAVENAIEVSPK